MSKIARGVAVVAGIAAAGLALLAAGGVAAPVIGKVAIDAGLAGGIAAGASVVSSLTAKRPVNVPAIDDYTVGPSTPYPYVMGRAKVAGNLIHQEAHGPEREGIPNPWMTQTFVYSGAGPVQAIESILVNNQPVTFSLQSGGEVWANGYYDKYLRYDGQVGNTPEATAVNTNAPGKTLWGSTSKLSGLCAAQFSMLLDKKDEQFRSGAPDFALVLQGVRAYDPRLDSTVPGGSGPCRLGQENTYVSTLNPACHAITYAFGRYQNNKLVFGGGMGVHGIDMASVIYAANVQDANGWQVNGIIYENGEDGETWNNLKMVLQAGGAKPTNDKGVLTFDVQAPRVAVDTIRTEDLEGEIEVPGMRTRKTGFNAVIPKYRSEANDWAYVESDEITNAVLEAAQGEKRTRERQYDLVTSANQSAQLGVYDVYDSVEIAPVSMLLGRRFLNYNVGDAFDTDLPDVGLVGLKLVCETITEIIETGQVRMTFRSDTTEKHAFALGQTGTAPPHPALIAQEAYDQAYMALEPEAYDDRAQAVSTSSTRGLTVSATDAGSDCTITISAHTRVYGNAAQYDDVSFTEQTITGLIYDQGFWLYYDDPTLTGLAGDPPAEVQIQSTISAINGYPSSANPYRHNVGFIKTPVSGGADTGGTTAAPPSAPPPLDPNDPGEVLP